MCPDCMDNGRDMKCKEAQPVFDLVGHLEIKPSDPFIKYPGLPNRTFGKLFETGVGRLKHKWNSVFCQFNLSQHCQKNLKLL